ncbi:helix-turn-helix transcriptional regulator [Bilophila wadsworthia]
MKIVIRSNIKVLMKEKKLNVREFAEMTGMSTATINKARRDNGILECRLSTLVRIADALGVKTKRLYEEVEGQEEEL